MNPNKPFRYFKNLERVELESVREHDYNTFFEIVADQVQRTHNHIAFYGTIPTPQDRYFLCLIADDGDHHIKALAHRQPLGPLRLESLANEAPTLQLFEREMAENDSQIEFLGHPWPKPVRFSGGSSPSHFATMDEYPFFRLHGHQTHLVGVGPIHAGVIEPGHFKFNCFGEVILNLEIHLGYQHRGWEQMASSSKTFVRRSCLAEGIAGDSALAHGLAFAQAAESLFDIPISAEQALLRSFAVEHERIAIHLGNLSAMATDVGYQLGMAVLSNLRTPTINYMQKWCGNRFGKGLIRVGGLPWTFTASLAEAWQTLATNLEDRAGQLCEEMFGDPTIQARFEQTGIVSRIQAEELGALGVTARASGLHRDIRRTHPTGAYTISAPGEVVEKYGDCWSRAKVRQREMMASLDWTKGLLLNLEYPIEATFTPTSVQTFAKPLMADAQPTHFVFSMVEGWRGQVGHLLVGTPGQGIALSKPIDPSFWNWGALELAVRGNQISDFPICNKSFDLSYCGVDL
jgi:Ni,Fe-hydrogenase III large subunit